MSSSSKLRFSRLIASLAVCATAIGLFTPSRAEALDITAYYVASCQRILGIPVAVDAREISVLKLDGTIQKLPRYEVIYVATYPLDLIPIDEVKNPELVRPIRILTRQRRQMVPLAEGWPVEFSDDRVSILTTEGRSVVVDRNSIWKIESVREAERLRFPSVRREFPAFVHPHVFQNCPLEPQATAKHGAQQVYPQQLLAETVTIKRELDRLMRGHEQIATYIKKQKFFAVPQYYRNETWLALWTSTGSRYGASASRSNNFTPLLRDEFSAGPFAYQRVFITGSGPHPSSVHDEAQTQATYQFKADYFHMELMADLSFILIGSKYRWNSNDFNGPDMRLNDVVRIAMGADFGRFSFTFFPVSTVNAGMFAGGMFREASTDFARFGFTFRLPETWFDVNFGSGAGDDTALRFLRINAAYEVNDATQLMASYISRDYDWAKATNSPILGASQSKTGAVYLEHHYHRRFLLGASAAIEHFRFTAQQATNSAALADESHDYFKFGILGGLIF